MPPELRRAAGLAYREAGPAAGPGVLLVHGFPESSYMWRHLLGPLGEAGFHALAPDLPGYGDSEPDAPGTWERHVAALDRFVGALAPGPVALVVHDWGGLIGLRWACESPAAVSALVVSNTGFFPDGRWHGFAELLRTPGEGEQAVAAMTRESLAALLQSSSTGIDAAAVDEYARVLADEARRRGVLELYRSGDFAKLEPYAGRLAALGVPALVMWGAEDPFAPVAGAHRFVRELPGAELCVLEGRGHFVFEDAPAETTARVLEFLHATGPAARPVEPASGAG